MKQIIIKIFLLPFISTIFSCNGKVPSKNHPTELKSPEVGKVVSQIDNQIWVVFQDAKGEYWFGSNGRGIFKFDGKTLL